MSDLVLPADLLDEVVDHLHDTKDALRSCCLVSKSWIPRARKHLFADIEFHDASNLRSWKNAFPDPSTSPACYTKNLLIKPLAAVAAADAEEGGWIPSFSQVVRVEIFVRRTNTVESLVSFHGFSLALKSLRLNFDARGPSRVFNLISSFPRLEDLSIIASFPPCSCCSVEQFTPVQPPNPPVLTGSLELRLAKRMEPIAHLLLSMPSGLRFRKLDFKWSYEEHVSLATALVERCCATLESLEIGCSGTFFQHLGRSR
jgi:hypothetical protein